MNEKIQKIQQQIKDECFAETGFVKAWFYDTHLLAVEKYAKFLLEKLPDADGEIVMLGVWLHDMQRIRGIDGDHQQVGMQEAEKILSEYGYNNEIIKKVKDCIATHSCEKQMPSSLEAQVLATADAMSHYSNDFYLRVAVTGERDLQGFKDWAFEKLDRDFNKKIMFDFAKDEIFKQHQIIKSFLTEI